jgi:hypothetical protein
MDREGSPERRARGIAAWPRHQILDLPSDHAEASWEAAPNMCAGSVCEAAYAKSQYDSFENSPMTPSDHFEGEMYNLIPYDCFNYAKSMPAATPTERQRRNDLQTCRRKRNQHLESP